jgi:cellulose synthase/poly-beta-1,6-N-acetylglucosamine synthase-like glycosyltransferase
VLSVVIPAYNEAMTIGRIVQNVVNAIPDVPNTGLRKFPDASVPP